MDVCENRLLSRAETRNNLNGIDMCKLNIRSSFSLPHFSVDANNANYYYLLFSP